MEENIFYEDNGSKTSNDTIKNSNLEKQITPITVENPNDHKQDELISSLPSWDLVPPYEEIRRVIK